MCAAIGADVFLLLGINHLIARPTDRSTAGTYAGVRSQVLLTGGAGDVPADRARTVTKWEFLGASGTNSYNQNGGAIGVANDAGVDGVIA